MLEEEESVQAGRLWHDFEPDYAHPPGETLRQTLDAIGMSQAEFARRADLSTKHVNQIIQGEAPITPDTAVALERVTRIRAAAWNGLEANYQAKTRLPISRQSLSEDDLAWMRAMPVRELIKRGFLPDTRDSAVLFERLLRFFRVANRRAWEAVWLDPDASFRRSAAFEAKPEATATWLRLAELKAANVECAPFDRAKFREAVDEVRRWVQRPVTPKLIREITELLAAAGVAFVLVRGIEGSRASGVTRWVSATRAYIALSLRYKRDDHFWFTFFHELAHVLLHGKRQMFVEFDQTQKAGTADQVAEAEADRFAEDALIPRAYVRRLRALISPSEHDIKALASEIEVPPGVVVGRMQRESLIRWSAHNELRVPVDLEAMTAVIADPAPEA